MQTPIDARKITWETLKKYVYEVDGSWRDIYVLDATRQDWEKWVDFVNANYRVAFNDQIEEHRDQIDFATVLHLWSSRGEALLLNATFFVAEIDVNCHFFDDAEIENDIDPRKIDSLTAHSQLMDYMARLSQALGKEVVLTGEDNSPRRTQGNRAWTPLISVNGDQVYVYPYWLDSSHY